MNGQPSADILPTDLFANAAQKAFTAPHAANDVLQVILIIYLGKAHLTDGNKLCNTFMHYSMAMNWGIQDF